MPRGNRGTSAVSELDTSAEPSFLSFLDATATAWHRLPNFPRYDETDQRDGDELVDAMATLLTEVDPMTIDRTASLPEGLIDDLRAAGFLALRNDTELGGRQASDYNAFRAVQRASRCSVTIGQLLAVHNGIGVPALLPSLPPGPLRETVARYVREGAVSGSSDTEPAGQNNRWRDTTATPTEDGRAYLLNGAKRFTSNAPVAGSRSPNPARRRRRSAPVPCPAAPRSACLCPPCGRRRKPSAPGPARRWPCWIPRCSLRGRTARTDRRNPTPSARSRPRRPV